MVSASEKQTTKQNYILQASDSQNLSGNTKYTCQNFLLYF